VQRIDGTNLSKYFAEYDNRVPVHNIHMYPAAVDSFSNPLSFIMRCIRFCSLAWLR